VPSIDRHKQREFAIEVVRTLRARGHEALWAGGCVRDELLGLAPKDYDVATTARPAEIRDIFGHRRTVAVGAAFGVICVPGPRHAGQIDVATFREDAPYSDGRHPDSVAFSTPEADARRRDFTINGLFYDPLDDRVIDYVGGQDDLARGIVRAIGRPHDRFAEDKLRLLRAVRFAAAFDFQLDPQTSEALTAMSVHVTQVSAERISAELRSILVHSNRVRGAILLRESGLLAAILPELAPGPGGQATTATGRNADEAWLETLEVLTVLVQPPFPLALAALVREYVDVAACQRIGRRWKLSNADAKRITWLVAEQNSLLRAREARWSRLQPLLVSEGVGELVALHAAIAEATGRPLDDVQYCRQLLQQPRDELDPPPLVTGDDLIAHGVPRGPEYHRLLAEVRRAQLDKQINTTDDAMQLIDALRANPGDGSG
jgi:poly(A) polymerase